MPAPDANDASRESERRFRALATASAAVLYQLSTDWSELQPLDGKDLVPSNDAPIRDWFERNVAAVDQVEVRARIERCIATKSPFEMEHRTNRPDGSTGWTRSRAVPVLDEAGEVIEWIGTAEDITDRKAAEEHLRRSHDTFYNLIQNNPFGVYLVDADFKLRQVSAGAQNVFAHVPPPLLGKDFAEVLRSVWTEPFASEAIGRFRHTLATGEPYVAVRTVEQRNDIEVVESYDWRIERITLPDGRFGVVCYFYDLSERQRWEAALRESEQRFRLMADAVPQIVWITDADGRALFFNQQWFKYTGTIDTPATAGDVSATFIHPDDGAATMAAFDEARRTGKTFAVEHRIRSASGEYRWFLVRGEPHRDPQTGQIIRWFGASVDIDDRRRAEQALRASEERATAILESIADGFFAVDRDWRVTYMNRRGEEILRPGYGRTREQMLGVSVWDLFPEIRGTLIEKGYREAMRDSVPVAVEVFYPPLDGWYDLRVYPSREGLSVYFLDITARKRTEEALRTSERRLRTFFESDMVGTFYWDMTGRIADANDQFLRMVGYTRADVLEGRVRWADMTPPEYRHLDQQSVADFKTTGVCTPYEKEYVRKDGSRVPVIVGGAMLDERRHEGVGFALEITDRKRAEADRQTLLEAERAARAEAETLAEVGRLVSGELDLQALVQKVTDATTKLTRAQFGAFFYNVVNDKGESYSLYTLSGVDREAFASFPMPRMTDVFGPTFRGGGVVRCEDVTKDQRYGRNAPHFGMPSGHLPVRSYLAVPVVSRSGEVLGGLFFGHEDVGVFSERDERLVLGIAAQTAVAMDNARLFDAARRANEAKDALLASEQAARGEAEQASRMKDEFLATLSHELRTPLSAILGWSQILKRKTRDPDVLMEGLATIERNARAQTQIIEDLLDMSRIISGKVRLDVQRIALEPVLRAAIDTVGPTADAKGVRVDAELDAAAGPVSGDPSRLQQVFWNLLTNAVKFTPRGGRVNVRLERRDAHLQVTVTDTGEGIPTDFLPHVFDRFRQADASITRRHGGLGLGLSIVKQLVELHGGSIQVESRGTGQGATFIVSLPIAPAVPPAASGSEPPHVEALGEVATFVSDDFTELSGLRVLVVDDEPDARALLKRLLEECKASVQTAASAPEAIATLQAERPDVLISDIGMPGEDGYALLRRVRALGADEGGSVPAIALTAYARAEDRVRALRAGFQMHVPKPVEPAELVAAVAALSRG